MSNTIKEFLTADEKKIEKIILAYPEQIPPNVVAEYFGMAPDSMRAAIANGEYGFTWLKSGKSTRGNCIPTAQFVRKVMNIKGLL